MTTDKYYSNIDKRFGNSYRIVPIFYRALMQRPDVLSWKMICIMGEPGSKPMLTTSWLFGEHMIVNDTETVESKILQGYGIEDCFFQNPMLALKNNSDLFITRFVFSKNLILVYDIGADKILFDKTKAAQDRGLRLEV